MKNGFLKVAGAAAVIGAMGLSSLAAAGGGISLRGLGPTGITSASSANSAIGSGPSVTTLANGFRTFTSEAHGTSIPLRDVPAITAADARQHAVEEADADGALLFPGKSGPTSADRVQQKAFHTATATGSTPSLQLSFNGANRGASTCYCRPPDTNGAVSSQYYVQSTNLAFSIYNKIGGVVLAPRYINLLFSALGPTASCAVHNDGDPVVNYDRLADRWVISQFTAEHPYNQCVAVSTSGDPAGTYNVYQFHLPDFNGTYDKAFQDYPKVAVWPDGYYMTTNQFPDNRSDIANYGANVYVFDRTAMLNGDEASVQQLPTPGEGGLLPADLDGTRLPPAGSPETVVENWNNNYHGSGSLKWYQLHIDWANPDNSTATSGYLAVAPWNWACTDGQTYYTRACFDQPGSGTVNRSLDAIGDRIMFRAAYRNFGDHDAMLVNQVVDTNTVVPSFHNTVHGGVRWYEIRNPLTSPWLYQQGTIAPNDGKSRWMASLAFDKNGDIAAGYSLISNTLTDSPTAVHPSIAYATRLATDPLGTFDAEQRMFTGSGYQTSSTHRWGDYSDMVPDPSNDCSMWYTTEYYNSIGASDPVVTPADSTLQATGVWKTRVGTFTIPGCTNTSALLNFSGSAFPRAISYSTGVASNGGEFLGSIKDTTGQCSANKNAVVNFGDNTVGGFATVTPLLSGCLYNVYAPSHTFESAGNYPITVELQRTDGSTVYLHDTAHVTG